VNRDTKIVGTECQCQGIVYIGDSTIGLALGPYKLLPPSLLGKGPV
jgi:hypothetical protein